MSRLLVMVQNCQWNRFWSLLIDCGECQTGFDVCPMWNRGKQRHQGVPNPDSAMRSLSASWKIYFLPKHLRWYQQSQVPHTTLSDLAALWHWPQGHLMFGPAFCSMFSGHYQEKTDKYKGVLLMIFFVNLLLWDLIHIKSSPDGF